MNIDQTKQTSNPSIFSVFGIPDKIVIDDKVVFDGKQYFILDAIRLGYYHVKALEYITGKVGSSRLFKAIATSHVNGQTTLILRTNSSYDEARRRQEGRR